MYACVPLKTRGKFMLGGVAPSFGRSQTKLVPNPPQLWNVPSGGWASARKAWPSAKLALGLAQRTWAQFCQIGQCAQRRLIHHMSYYSELKTLKI